MTNSFEKHIMSRATLCLNLKNLIGPVRTGSLILESFLIPNQPSFMKSDISNLHRYRIATHFKCWHCIRINQPILQKTLHHHPNGPCPFFKTFVIQLTVRHRKILIIERHDVEAGYVSDVGFRWPSFFGAYWAKALPRSEWNQNTMTKLQSCELYEVTEGKEKKESSLDHSWKPNGKLWKLQGRN